MTRSSWWGPASRPSLAMAGACLLVLGAPLGCLCTGSTHGGDSAIADSANGDGGGATDSAMSLTCPGGTDLDGDGYGEGCAAGEDCNDSDFTSYPGAPELCDGRDNDCDIQVDEGALNECGTCNPNCDSEPVGMNPFPQPSDMPPPPNVDADGVSNDPNGDIILDSTNVDFHFAWIANHQEGTVSKLDTETGSEVARYDTVLMTDVPTVPIPHPCASGCCNCPSRTAVDWNGDAWVANRAINVQGSATKIGNEIANCVDRNLNGFIDTSADQNGNTIIDWDCDGDGLFDTLSTVCTNGLPPEFLGQDDECLLFSVTVGTGYSLPRALALDVGNGPGAAGNAWVGSFNEAAFYKYDGATGALLARVPATGSLPVCPYGAAIDSNGTLWAADRCGGLGLFDIDTATNTPGTLHARPPTLAAGMYGIAVDGNDHIWMGGYASQFAFVYNPTADLWEQIDTGQVGWTGRGVGADGFGRVWMSMHTASPFSGGRVVSIDIATRTVLNVFDTGAAAGASTPVGAGVAFDGSIWSINQGTSNASRIYIDPVTGVAAAHPATGNIIDVFPVGTAPYTYSDFTGFGLRNFTNPTGTWSYWVEGCANGDPATWLRVEWNSTEPPGTDILLSTRTADTVMGLDTASEFGTWSASPAYLDSAPGPIVPNPSRYLEVIFQLTTFDPLATPVLHDFNLVWECPNPIG